MTMNPTLEIIIPTRNPESSFAETVASLVAQTDRQFDVLLCDNHSTAGLALLDAAQKKLSEAGISVRRMQTPGEVTSVEHWNCAHSQGRADWLKPLFAGERLRPIFVERFKQRIIASSAARIICCDLELKTEWGIEKRTAPFQSASISGSEFTNYFPAYLDWLTHSANFVYNRTAWRAMGGYSRHLPGNAALNLNVILALHHGVENLPELLVEVDCPDGSSANGNCNARISNVFELWLILLQARNYSLAAKLPWPMRFLFVRSLFASLRR
jgi:glycosyltransferase involved in cell wall biosynthesis